MSIVQVTLIFAGDLEVKYTVRTPVVVDFGDRVVTVDEESGSGAARTDLPDALRRLVEANCLLLLQRDYARNMAKSLLAMAETPDATNKEILRLAKLDMCGWSVREADRGARDQDRPTGENNR
jgi:hypothetical protein